MKTDDEKSFRLFSDKKTGENLSFSRASIYFGRKREREKSVVAGCFRREFFSRPSSLSLSSLASLNKEVRSKGGLFNPPIHKTLNF